MLIDYTCRSISNSKVRIITNTFLRCFTIVGVFKSDQTSLGKSKTCPCRILSKSDTEEQDHLFLTAHATNPFLEPHELHYQAFYCLSYQHQNTVHFHFHYCLTYLSHHND